MRLQDALERSSVIGLGHWLIQSHGCTSTTVVCFGQQSNLANQGSAGHEINEDLVGAAEIAFECYAPGTEPINWEQMKWNRRCRPIDARAGD